MNMERDMDTTLNAKQLLGLDKVASLLDVSKREVQRLIAANELPAPVKIGRLSKLKLGDVDAYVQKLTLKRNGNEKN